jgi:REP element-mobilizing transposase RayT
MNRGVNRGTVFFDDTARLEFGQRLADVHERFGVQVLAYCLMGNHYHLLVRTEPRTLSPAMQHLGSVYVQRTNQRLGRDGPLFRGRFHAIPVTTDAYLLAAFRYIHQNPLVLSGVESVIDYRWSSARTHFGLRPAPRFVDTTYMSAMFGGSVDALAAFHGASGWHDVLSFDRETAVDTLDQLVQLAIAIDDLGQAGEAGVPPRLARTIALLLDDDIGVSEQLLDQLRGPSTSPDARRLALQRARQRRETDPTIERVIHILTTHLAPTVAV